MRRIDVRDLPAQADEELSTGATYRVECDGDTTGFTRPVTRTGPERTRRAFEEFARMFERMRLLGAEDDR
jgi:hypothetical protein